MKPATELPWDDLFPVTRYGGGEKVREHDREYAIHAVNAYPRLVEALRECRVIGSPVAYSDTLRDKVDALLRELGEAK